MLTVENEYRHLGVGEYNASELWRQYILFFPLCLCDRGVIYIFAIFHIYVFLLCTRRQ